MAVWMTAGGKEIAVVSATLCAVWFFDATGKELHKVTMPQFRRACQHRSWGRLDRGLVGEPPRPARTGTRRP